VPAGVPDELTLARLAGEFFAVLPTGLAGPLASKLPGAASAPAPEIIPPGNAGPTLTAAAPVSPVRAESVPIDHAAAAGRPGAPLALDGAAARLAAGHYTPHLAQRGRQLLEVGRRAVASGNIPSVIEADIDFHLFVYEASGNPVIGETAQPHWQHLRRVMAAALGAEDLRVSVWDEHEGILRALEAGQVAEAEALARGHTEQMSDILTGRLKAVISRAA